MGRLSKYTVDEYLASALRKLGARNRAQAIAIAIAVGAIAVTHRVEAASG